MAEIENKKDSRLKKLRDLIFFGDNVIMIYQMGKVGSTTIENALKAESIKYLHMHYIANLSFRPTLTYPPKRKVISTIRGYVVRLWYRFRVLRRRKTKIITLVREPVGRTISQLFHNAGEDILM